MTEKNKPGIIESIIYVQVGAIQLAKEVIEHAEEVGEALVASKLRVAKSVGKFTIDFGSREIEAFVSKLFGSTNEPVFDDEVEEIDEDIMENDVESIDANSLAIPGYDSLAASQVIQRLNDLSDEQLKLVEDYELSHRQRRTILAKLAQLSS